jgi:SAM-dependent methyltransferase
MATSAIDRERAIGSTALPFIVTIFVGSFLLFLVQPMVARLALPRLGGAPSVWNSAMLVYQALLLAGYAYAHWLGRAALRRQAAIHLALFALAALTLPIGLIAAEPSAQANPFLWVPWLLIVSIGPLFFVVSAQAPLIQRWYSLVGERDPYPLYAASNFGSFAGLLSYPLLVEPLVPLREQRWVWSIAYILLALLVAWCALKLPRHANTSRTARSAAPAPAWRERAAWVLLAAVPSGLILSTTLHLTTDIGAMPLLWVLPLSVYLLSFTVAFASKRGLPKAISRIAPLILLFAAFGLFTEVKSIPLFFGAVAIVNLFTVSVAIHSQLFERRPDPQYLTFFYLMLSIGGVLGGIFCALVAPLVFDWTYEHVILLVAAAFLMTTPSLFDRFARLWNGDRTARRLTWIGIALIVVLALEGKGLFGLPAPRGLSHYSGFAIIAVAIVAIGNRALFATSVAALMICVGGWERMELSARPGALTRSYFGIYSVRSDDGTARMLAHGTTLHGVQILGSPERERIETTYYAPLSGVGLAMQAAPQMFGRGARIDVVGLGAGTLACYSRPGQRWTFYEIDPVVVQIARNPAQFTFLSRCLPQVPIVVGDARLTLGRAPAGSADLLVVDAFSSDAIPIHLLTREAFAVYRRRLASDGLLLIHISNRYLDLEPVVAAAAATGGWHAAERWYRPAPAGRLLHETSSIWIALSPSLETMNRLTAPADSGWTSVKARTGFEPWSDDHASVLPLLTWRS